MQDDFVGETEEELSLNAGEEVEVVTIEDDGWWVVRSDDGRQVRNAAVAGLVGSGMCGAYVYM